MKDIQLLASLKTPCGVFVVLEQLACQGDSYCVVFRCQMILGASYNGSTTVSKTVSVGSIPPAPATEISA